MRRIGKIGRRNLKANKKLKEIFLEKCITKCEMCGNGIMLTFAHKYPREHYRISPERLYDFNETLLLCMECHQRMDDRSLTTEKEKNKIYSNKRNI